jgi:ribose transport system substrate-binding protein
MKSVRIGRRPAWALLSLSLVVVAAVVSGCGSGSGSSSSSSSSSGSGAGSSESITVAYITPALDVPFWKWTSDGVHEAAEAVGAEVDDYDSNNDGSTQLQNAQDAISKHVDAIIISPTESSTTPAVLNLADQAGIPVVIAFIGTTEGEYVSYLTSTDEQGAQEAGKYLAEQMAAHGWKNSETGTVTIPLSRINGKERLAGFEKAMKETGNTIADQLQFKTDTIQEDATLVQDILTAHPNIHGFFCQSDDCTLAAAQVLQQKGLLNTEVLLAGFDASPATVEKIEAGTVLASAVQQPVTVGRKAFEIAYEDVAKGTEPSEKEITVPTILVSKDNVKQAKSKLVGTAFPKGSE